MESPSKRKKTQSHEKAQKTRGPPTVSCTPCWTAGDNGTNCSLRKNFRSGDFAGNSSQLPTPFSIIRRSSNERIKPIKRKDRRNQRYFPNCQRANPDGYAIVFHRETHMLRSLISDQTTRQTKTRLRELMQAIKEADIRSCPIARNLILEKPPAAQRFALPASGRDVITLF